MQFSKNACKIYWFVKQVWQGPLSNGSYVVVIVNRFNEPKDITMDWAKDAKIPIHVNSDNRFELQDLWNGKVVGQVVIGESVWNSHLATHENQAFKLTPILQFF